MPKQLPNPDASNVKAIPMAEPLTTSQFPRISRFIPEKLSDLQKNVLYPKLFIVSFISGILLIGIIAQSVLLITKLTEMKALVTERQDLAQEIAYWKTIDQQYKGYRDVDLKLATLEYKIGNINDAKQYIQKAFTVDPNTKDGKVLGERIERTTHN